jgi:probable selenium-dependent hydroxylase accessory protein YqeC
MAQHENLIELLGLTQGDVVSLVGAGGKSTLMLRLYREGTDAGWRVVCGTTTRVWEDEANMIRGFLYSRKEGEKVIGVPPMMIDAHVRGELHGDLTVIEADGSAGLPFKAPAAHEPVLAQSTSVVACVIGADALNRVIEDQGFRPMRIAALAGCSPYERLTPERAARVLASDDGGRRSVGDGMRYIVVINKVTPDSHALADELQRLLSNREVDTVQVPWTAE